MSKNLKAWWVRDGKFSHKVVKNIEEAIKWLDEQTNLDLDDDSITWNAGGLEEFDEEMKNNGCDGWCEYYNEDGLDIMEIMTERGL